VSPGVAFSRRQLFVGGALGAATAFALAGCATEAGATAAKTFNWGFSMPTSWDPVTSRTGNDVNQLNVPYASLTQFEENGDIGAGLAESWTYNGDGTAVTFHLREGLTFSDGTDLDAAAVVAFFTRMKNQKDSANASYISDFASVSADSTTDVTIHLTQPDYQVPALVSGRIGMITSSKAAGTDGGKLDSTPVGAGPFKMIAFVPEASATFVKNPTYYRADEIKLERLEITVAPDASTLVTSVQSGVVSMATLPATQVEEARAAGLTVTIKPSLAVYDASINKNKAPFDNPKVVEAFRYAFDRDEFVKAITQGYGATASQPFPPSYAGYNKAIDDLYSYDPDKAVSLLKEAGYSSGDLSIGINVLSTGTTEGEVFQDQLKKIGVKSTITVVPAGSTTWQNKVYVAKNAQFAADSTIGRESPVQNLLATYGSTGIMNLSGPDSSAAFNAALTKVRETPLDAPSYKTVLGEAIKAGVEQSPTNYLFTLPWIIVSTPKAAHVNLKPNSVRWEGVTLS
jgi:peptide/nickel transport system substrate-binding protein